MRERIVKIGILALLLVALLIPSTTALAADEEASWTTLASISNRADFQTEAIDGKIYAVGGCLPTNGPTFLSSAEVYDPSTNVWTALAPMSTARRNFQTEVLDGKIYAIGGMGESGASAEVYDPSTNVWTTLAPMSTARVGFKTAVFDGKIYAIGGDKFSSAEVYDPSTNVWTTLAPMSTDRSTFLTEVINGKIYVIGGYGSGTSLSSVEVYNPATNTWKTLAPMSAPRYNFQTEVINGKIYAIGGCSKGPNLSSVEVYDPATNVWTTWVAMSTLKSESHAEMIDGKIYVIGRDSMECYTVKAESPVKQLKVVLGVGENLQLSVSNDLSKNEDVTWTSSDSAVASVNTSGIVTAVAPGNAVITVSDGGSYTESIHILVVENADEYRLAVDLKVDKTCQLTVDDNTNTFAGTWTSMDPSVATVSSSGKVKAAGAGLAFVTASDADGKEVGQVYVRVRT